MSWKIDHLQTGIQVVEKLTLQLKGKNINFFYKFLSIKSKYFSHGRPHLIYSWHGFYNELFILYFLMEFSQYLKIPFLWDPCKQNSELPKQMCERMCSYSERHLLLILWLIGNHKTQVWSSITHITFLKDEDNSVHFEIHTPTSLVCMPYVIKSLSSSVQQKSIKLQGSKIYTIFV